MYIIYFSALRVDHANALILIDSTMFYYIDYVRFVGGMSIFSFFCTGFHDK